MIPGRAPRLLPALLAAAAALLASPDARAGDLLLLKDGQVVEGVRMERTADAVILKYRNGDVRVPLDRVEDVLVEGAPPPPPATEEEKAKRDAGLVPWKGKWIPPAAREKEIRKDADARRKAIEDYRGHREWRNRYRFSTRNFDFESTLTPSLNEEFSELLETYFREFAKFWKVTVPPKWGRLKVCFHGSLEDFHRTGGAGGGTLAYYRFVAPRELHFFYDRSDPAFSVACLFHEANHYLTDLMDERFQYPHWVNEAMAEYYGSAAWDRAAKAMRVGAPQHGRLAEVAADIEAGRMISLRDLVTSETSAYLHYYWGWSLVHFLMETPKYRVRFTKFFADLADGRDVARVVHPSFPEFTVLRSGQECLRVFLTRMNLKEADLPALQEEWYAHIRALAAGDSLAGLEQGGLRAIRDGYWKFRAPRLLKAAIEKGSVRPEVHLAYARCLAMRPDPAVREEILRALEKATSLEPLDADLWAGRALVTWALGDEAGAERWIGLAREIDPEGDFLDYEVQKKILQKAREGGEDP